MAGLDDAVRNAVAVKPLAGLIHQHNAIHDEHGARILACGFLQHEAGDLSLAGAGRRHEDLLAAAGGNAGAGALDGFDLIVAEGYFAH